MALDKMWTETRERLDRIEKMLADMQRGMTAEAKPAVTKKQLMDIEGVGAATADKILELLV